MIVIIVISKMYAVLNSLEINFMAIISFNPHTVPSVSHHLCPHFKDDISLMSLDKCLGF